MNNKTKSGVTTLAKKALTIISASLSALISNQIKAAPATIVPDGLRNDNHESIQRINPSARLVLKLNVANPENSLTAMHASHSSHASHASHSSHMSSSSTYDSPNYSSPAPPPPSPPPQPSTPHAKSTANSNSTSLTQYTLGSRILYQGCQGTDVQELQQLLLNLGYDVPTTGYFGDKTKAAVGKFQRANEINPDGKVGNTTLNILKK